MDKLNIMSNAVEEIVAYLHITDFSLINSIFSKGIAKNGKIAVVEIKCHIVKGIAIK